ncbi:DUF1292 domain-containing protein [Desulfofundulus sp.]|uniref:DUF1292 domain-containing protein n=1 Tax=Desulfofundulus sp. TaxID=2282750 RepID=UPI003C75E781
MPEQELELEEVVTLVDEDGKEQDFEVIDIIHLDDSKYAVLLPLEETGDDEAAADEGEAIILKFEKDEDGNEILVDIEDDEEWEKVADYWEEMVAGEDS